MNDTISRRTAIEACESIKRSAVIEDGEPLVRKSAVKYVLDNLPSAEPQIIHCKDCKHHWTHRCMDSMPTEVCDLNQTFYDPNIDFCSLAERRIDE